MYVYSVPESNNNVIDTPFDPAPQPLPSTPQTQSEIDLEIENFSISSFKYW